MNLRLRCQECGREIVLYIPGVAWCCGREMSVRWNRPELSGAAKLQRGEQIQDFAFHHKAMAEWKRQLGDPRPAGLTLSRICPDDCPEIYEGRNHGSPHMLCLREEHYAWETMDANNARKSDSYTGASGR